MLIFFLNHSIVVIKLLKDINEIKKRMIGWELKSIQHRSISRLPSVFISKILNFTLTVFYSKKEINGSAFILFKKNDKPTRKKEFRNRFRVLV